MFPLSEKWHIVSVSTYSPNPLHFATEICFYFLAFAFAQSPGFASSDLFLAYTQTIVYFYVQID